MNLTSAIRLDGRLGRKAYAEAMGENLLAGVVLGVVGLFMATQDLLWLAFSLWAALAGVAAIMAASTVRRLHDRGLSGWWLFAWAALGLLTVMTVGTGSDRPLSILAKSPMILASVFMLSQCLVFAGQAFPNSYGRREG